MKEILKNVIQKVHRECNRRENKRKFMSMVAMLCVFSIVSTSVMQSSMIQVAANARTGSNAVYTPSNVQTPSDTDGDGGSGSGDGTSVETTNSSDVATPSDAQVATPSNPIFAGILVCGIDDEGHVHDQSCYCEDEAVADVILRIHALPTADEIDATLLAYEEAEDWEAYEEYFAYIANKGRFVYEAYEELSEEQKLLVFNIDKLMEWDYIWSMVTYVSQITSEQPQIDDYTSTSDFVELNLYNYTKAVNTKYWGDTSLTNRLNYPGFQWNGGAYKYDTDNIYSVDDIDFGNSMITDYEYSGNNNIKSTTSTNVARQGGAINQITKNTKSTGGDDWTNYPIGMSTLKNSYNTNTAAKAEVMNRLLVNGYPALLTGESLDYLFKETKVGSTVVSTKKNQKDSSGNYITIDGLFLQDETTGAYSYNSRDNHAQYDSATGNFVRYKQIITPNFILYPFGNFLPFNDITNGDKATQVSAITNIGSYINNVQTKLTEDGSASANQLNTMLTQYETNLNSKGLLSSNAGTVLKDFIAKGGPGSDISIPDSHMQRMYNIDWNVDTEFFFGMDMTMNFMQPKDGMTGKDTNQDGTPDYPMEFYFTGDDDVWVYLDGVLFLDLTGIHRHVGGKIDFVNGKVHYYGLDTAGSGDVSSTPYATYTFEELLQAARKSTSVLNSKGTFKDYSTHEFKFFYMERGSGSSVCRLNFNFPLLKKNTISIEKELSSDGNTDALGNPDFNFQVLKADSNGNKTSEMFIGKGISYDIYEGDEKVGTGTTDANGVITIKKGQRAEIGNIAENAGKFYVRELLSEDAFKQYGEISVDGSSVTSSNDVEIGSDTFKGVNSPVKDVSDGATVFHFNNKITFNKLGHLQISKVFNAYEGAGSSVPTEPFEFKVQLSGTDIPLGTKYTIDSSEQTVTEKGVIKVPAGKTAVISNIVAGTTFEIEETSNSSANFSVEYSGVTGTILTDETSSATITNNELGDKIFIPLEKILTNADGNDHSYSFKLVQVDENGIEITDGYCNELVIGFNENDKGYVTINKDENNNDYGFTIYYLSKNIPDEGATFYYKIYENASDSSDLDSDESIYLVTTSVTKDSSSDVIDANVVISKNGTEVSTALFTNTLLSSITIRKEVSGSLGDRSKQFDFTATATDGTFIEENISGECTVNEDGSQITFKLAHGNELTINKLPVGTEITVKENYKQSADETIAYTVKVAQGSSTVDADEMSTTIAATNEKIVFTNTKEARPDTGILLDSWPYLLILVIALAGIVGFVIHKRKETDLD